MTVITCSHTVKYGMLCNQLVTRETDHPVVGSHNIELSFNPRGQTNNNKTENRLWKSSYCYETLLDLGSDSY